MNFVESLKKTYESDGPLLKMPSAFVREESGVSTLFIIKIAKGSKAFRYNVDITKLTSRAGGDERETNLAKGSDE